MARLVRCDERRFMCTSVHSAYSTNSQTRVSGVAFLPTPSARSSTIQVAEKAAHHGNCSVARMGGCRRPRHSLVACVVSDFWMGFNTSPDRGPHCDHLLLEIRVAAGSGRDLATHPLLRALLLELAASTRAAKSASRRKGHLRAAYEDFTNCSRGLFSGA